MGFPSNPTWVPFCCALKKTQGTDTPFFLVSPQKQREAPMWRRPWFCDIKAFHNQRPGAFLQVHLSGGQGGPAVPQSPQTESFDGESHAIALDCPKRRWIIAIHAQCVSARCSALKTPLWSHKTQRGWIIAILGGP